MVRRPDVSAQVTALGLVFNLLSGGAVSIPVGMAIGVVSILAYTLFGGMWSVAVTDFIPSADPNGPQFPHRTMTPEELTQLGVQDFEGGFQGLPIHGPDGKAYTLAARPILPGETE